MFPVLGVSYAKQARPTVMLDLWVPLCPDVFVGCWRDDREAEQEDVCLWVGEGAEAAAVSGVRSSRGVPKKEYKSLCSSAATHS